MYTYVLTIEVHVHSVVSVCCVNGVYISVRWCGSQQCLREVVLGMVF